MKSSKVQAQQTAEAQQYNDLRDDAFGGSQLLARQQATPNMTLRVENGVVYVGNTRVAFAGGNSPAFTAPTTNPKIDLLVIDSAGTLSIVAGTEAASPSPPAYPPDKVVLCEVFLRVGSTAIFDTDQGTNAYILRDVRPILKSTGEPKNYSDVTASRVIDTVYQNTSGRWKLVAITLSCFAAPQTPNQTGQGGIYIGSTTPPTSKIGEQRITNAGAGSGSDITDVNSGTITFLVPPSFFYKVANESVNGGTVSIVKWWEAELPFPAGW